MMSRRSRRGPRGPALLPEAGCRNCLRKSASRRFRRSPTPGDALRATLRPYQRQGAHWLWFMNRLGLGACLADDMGLGKTIQVLSLLVGPQTKAGSNLPRRPAPAPGAAPSLLIVPASLIANWRAGGPALRSHPVGVLRASG